MRWPFRAGHDGVITSVANGQQLATAFVSLIGLSDGSQAELELLAEVYGTSWECMHATATVT